MDDLAIFPIKNQDLWDMYKKAESCFWVAEEINLYEDLNDWKKMTQPEQYFISMILAFFAQADGIVNLNVETLLNLVPYKEAKFFYGFQIAMENIHNETYSLQIENIVRDPEEKTQLLEAVKNYECIAQKAEWAVKWIESTDSFARRVVAFAIVEGIFFSGSFCAIYWLKKRNLMPGLCASNELIARDESSHCRYAVLLYSQLENKLPESEVHAIFVDAVEIETDFICESLPCSLIGMNSTLMTQYIKFVADRLLLSLGYTKYWNATNPFDFMESISLEGKKNFFEGRPTEYQKSSVLNKSKDNVFTFSNDF